LFVSWWKWAGGGGGGGEGREGVGLIDGKVDLENPLGGGWKILALIMIRLIRCSSSIRLAFSVRNV